MRERGGGGMEKQKKEGGGWMREMGVGEKQDETEE